VNNSDRARIASRMASSFKDIPEALREAPSTVPKPRRKNMRLVIGLAALGVIALFAGFWAATLSSEKPNAATAKNSQPASQAAKTPTSVESTKTSLSQPDIVVGKSGHFAYKEAPAEDLQPITGDPRLKLRKKAAQQFNAMLAAARATGVNIVTISAFRSVAEQQHLFFDVKAQRGQAAAERATVSAPPGYSEHHTGYAVDVGDGSVPATNLNPNFEKTAAYKWLQANAARFSFEMSFPKNNAQNVSYEPWHWRFVGDQQSLETFYKAKNISPNSSDTKAPPNAP